MPDQKISADPLLTSPTQSARVPMIDPGTNAALNYQVAPSGAKVWLATGAADLSATGTRSSTTFLRGDNTWAVPAGGGGGGATTAAGITDFTEASQDVIGAMFTAAGGTYNDAAGTIGFPSAGGASLPRVTKTANFTLAQTDMEKILECDSTSEIVITIETDAVVLITTDSMCLIRRLGTGAVRIVRDATDVNVRTASGYNLRVRNSEASLSKRAANDWFLGGDLS